jgi:hypothetical protein
MLFRNTTSAQPWLFSSPYMEGTPDIRLSTMGLSHVGGSSQKEKAVDMCARVEKALTRRHFRHMLWEGRVIVPAGGWFEWLRHEVARVIVRRSHPAEPAVPSAVPYEVWRSGNGPSKSPRTMQPPSQDGCRTRERTACLPASRRVGARVYGMVSVSEPRWYRQP